MFLGSNVCVFVKALLHIFSFAWEPLFVPQCFLPIGFLYFDSSVFFRGCFLATSMFIEGRCRVLLCQHLHEAGATIEAGRRPGSPGQWVTRQPLERSPMRLIAVAVAGLDVPGLEAAFVRG